MSGRTTRRRPRKRPGREAKQALLRQQTPPSIGPYRIQELIGQGAMGSVFRATTPDGKLVAVKTLNRELAEDEEMEDRFEHEWSILHDLHHAGIAKAIDIGEEGTIDYFVMEFIEGRNIRQLLNEGALDLDASIDIILQAALALLHAHEHHVVHRDIKPANIILTDDNTVKIVDFGIARHIKPGTTRLTQVRCLMGTPSYMSPEQQLDSRNVDHRTDIYSLGVTFYEMISGRLPTGLMSMKLIPRKIRAILKKCIAYNKEDRYASLSLLIDDLRDYRVGSIMRNEEDALGEIEKNSELQQVLIRTLYPQHDIKIPEADLACLYSPADGIGGDYYDFIEIDQNHIGILIGNVFERPNVEAALFLTMVRSAFRIFARRERNPGKVLTAIHHHILQDQFDHAAALTYVVFDRRRRTLTMASGMGKPIVLLRAGSGVCRYINPSGSALGKEANAHFKVTTRALHPGDIIAMYAAGIVEATNLADDRYGQERLERCLRAHRQTDVLSIIRAVEHDITTFAGGVAQNDDMTFLILKVLPEAAE